MTTSDAESEDGITGAQDSRDRRSDRAPAQDEVSLANIRGHIAELPNYGYRRVGALLN
ncbi:hypothetical protein [Delftia acidovorans]|uniref:Uncharacterized protein n=1 Tax=Delftia acidovorans TaxID=80866 RepID=A0AAJ2R673_DELAC|nr:hypothetical protein [Delftia acidovorans]MDX4956561.1 hypothetical protein [Delftia acidovorans]